MLIVTAHNVTPYNAPEDTAEYDVVVRINERKIWGGYVTGHIRADGFAPLLRRIADAYDHSTE